MHLPETAGVPKLVAEVAAQLDVLFVENDVLSQRRGAHNAQAQGVGAILGDEVERIGRIAQALGHLPPEFVADDAGEINVAERHLPRVLETGEDHPRDPEKNNLRRRHQHRRGIELGARRFVHRGERPKPRRKPGIQHIRVLGESKQFQLFDHILASRRNGNAALILTGSTAGQARASD